MIYVVGVSRRHEEAQCVAGVCAETAVGDVLQRVFALVDDPGGFESQHRRGDGSRWWLNRSTGVTIEVTPWDIEQ